MNALKQFQLLLMVIVMMSSQAMAASFSAQFVTIRNGKTELGKFYLQDQRYRLEINEDGRTAIVIADRKTAQHTIIDRKAGTYFQISSNDFGVLANDPFKASEHVAGQYGIQDLGEDRVSGIACEKQLVQVQGTKVMTRWYSAELDFPLRVIMHQGKHDAIAELRSIRKMPLEANLFMTPDGLRQVEAPGAAAKRKRKEAAEKEAALAGLHGTGSP